MDEYIEREAAYEDFEKCNSENPKWTPSRVKAFIARQKAADVAPVQHGKWELSKNYVGYCSCSLCSDCYVEPEWVDRLHWRFCPSCGARMDGGNDG